MVIGRVVKGGAAERSGNLHPGGRDHDYDDDDDDYDYEEEEIRVKAAHPTPIPMLYILLHSDEVLEVNGLKLCGKSVHDICSTLCQV